MLQQYFPNQTKSFQRLTAALVVLVVAGLGIYLLTSSHAATPYASITADSGNPGNGATKQTCTGASDGSCVVFGGAQGSCETEGCLVQTLFNAAGPIASPIPANPVIDSNSAHYVSELASGTPGGNVLGFGGTTEWGITYYYSTASDPSYNITFAKLQDWFGGVNPFDTVVKAVGGSGSCNPLHIPDSATVPGGYDQASDFSGGNEAQPDSSMWIIDKTKPGLACFIWQASKQTGTWTGSAGGVFDLNGTGASALTGFGVGSGMTQNTILESEIQNGVIPHALNFAWICNGPGYRAPANGSDGQCSGGDMEEGMRFQLNPSYNCAGLATKAAQIVCVALQKYGMYDGDSGGGGVGFDVQTDDFSDPARSPWKTPGEPARQGGIYCNVGLCTSSGGLGIPISQFRLLNSWNGD